MIKNLHYIYLVIALPIVLITARITPPFQVPDEPHHFCRAEQVSQMRWVAAFHAGPSGPRTLATDSLVLLPEAGGFITDRGIQRVDSVYAYLEFKPGEKVRAERVAMARDIYWGRDTVYGAFTNTAIYPPSGYLTSALGIGVGRMIGLSVVNTLYFSRWLNGLFCVLICFYALRLARGMAPLLFVVLLFPMTISMFASVSQDGILISYACLFAALVYNTESGGGQYSPRRKLLMILCMAAICAAKPPYFPLALVFFFLSLRTKEKVVCFSTVLVLVVAWGLMNHQNYGIVWAPAERRINAPLQLHHILQHPLDYVGMFFKVDWPGIRDHIWMFIGLLGWEDLFFPLWFYKVAFLMVLVAMLLSARLNFREDGRLRLAMLVCLVLAFGGILTGQYVTWMPLDSPALGGVQSRYFIPLIPFLGLALGLGRGAGDVDRSVFGKARVAGLIAIVLFGLISQVMLVEQILGRYYM